MSAKLTVKPREKVSESGIYEATRSGKRMRLKKGQYAIGTPHLGEEWEQVIDPDRLRRSLASVIAKTEAGSFSH